MNLQIRLPAARVRLLIICLFGGLISGCSALRAPAPQSFDFPVAISCVKADAIAVKPDYKFDKLPVTASDGEKVIALASDWPAGRKYEGQLEAVIAGCR